MKLNSDCIRDILLSIESCDTDWDYPSNKTATLEKYEQDVVLYHLEQCELSGLLNGYVVYFGPQVSVMGLMPRGHEFLDNIRNTSGWGKVKEIAAKGGKVALNSIIQIATQVAGGYLSGAIK